MHTMIKNQPTLTALLQQRAVLQADHNAFTFLEGETSQTLTNAELFQQASAIATGLNALALPGDRVVLLCPPGLDYIKLFYGCLLAGVIAVPLYPPRLKQRTDRISKVVQSCGANLAVTCDSLLPSLSAYFEISNDLAGGQLMSVGQLSVNSPSLITTQIEANDLAFIQYTSGSTGAPKGVMVSHHNIMANLAALEAVTGAHDQDVFVNWLPLFHDLGLINTLMLPVYLGCHSVLMNPAAFVQKPAKWFDAITAFGGTICGAPNFAFDLCVQKIRDAQLLNVDLSSWRLAFNAAEPINPLTLSQFSQRFAANGFDGNAFYPSYGMAEATVFLTGGDALTPPIVRQFDQQELQLRQANLTKQGGRELVGCGRIPPKHSLSIVDSETLDVKTEGQIGEIWVSGPSIAQGYWQLDEQSDITFKAFTQKGDGPFLRTGDLGFICDGELYISGRIKDVMIVRGQNYYPHDIELCSALSHEDLIQGSCSAFCFDDGQVVVVQEIKARAIQGVLLNKVHDAIRNAISRDFDLKVEVVLIRPGTLPKTSSGKVQRSAAKQAYIDAELLDITPNVVPQNSAEPVKFQQVSSTESALLSIWAETFKEQQVTVQSDFFSLGGDSLDATKLSTRIEKHFALRVTVESIYEYSELAALAVHLDKELTSQQHTTVMAIQSTGKKESLLSFSQQRLWFLHQMENQNKVLNLPAVLRFTGKLQTNKLNVVFNRLVERHAILRTSYHWEKSQVWQRINPLVPFAITTSDLTHLSEHDTILMEVITNEAQQVFDLQASPIFRLHLLKLSQEEHLLLFTIHHIAADAWSMDVLINDMKLLYVNETAVLPPLNINYLDFADWQLTQASQGRFEVLANYWCQQLKDIPALLSLPYKQKRPDKQTFAGQVLCKALPVVLAERLQTLSQRHKTTLFVTMLSAFQINLKRLSGQQDIVVGTDVANRNNSQLSDLMGFFVNQLVLRNHVDGTYSFEQLLNSNKKMMREALANQDMPFDRLIDELGVERSLQYSPLFQVKFLLNHSPADALELPGLDIELIPQQETVSQYDLTLCIDHKKGQQFELKLHYNTDLFCSKLMETLLTDYLLLLESIVQQPAQKIQHLPCATTESKAYQNWQVGNIQPMCDVTNIVASIERQAQTAPEQPAIYCDGETLTYQALNEQANKLANLLVDIGIEDMHYVGVHLPRSINQIISLLAIAKSGATFLPLDPEYPCERIQYMLNDSEVELVLTDDTQHAHLADFCGAILHIDAQISVAADESIVAPSVNIDPANLAYLLYTSGSSGRPKGAKIANQSLWNLCHWYIDFADLNADSVLLQPIPLSFDASIKNIFAPLMVGAKLVLPAPGPYDPKSWAQLIKQQKISILNCVPSVFYPIIDSVKSQSFAPLQSLKLLALGGESADINRLTPWLSSALCQCFIANIYGPTECTDISAAWKGNLSQLSELNAMPIGSPITNVQVFVVNSDNTLALPNVPGELLIKGAGVGQGYHGSANDNQQAFVDDPFAANEKVYRTGDLVYWDDKGQLHYIGRTDNQVKVNGVRIETAEIETCICEMKGFSQASVMQNRGQLLAYVETQGLTPPTSSQLRGWLSQRFPHSWLPKHIIFISALPILPNGKIDRECLLNMPVQQEQEGRLIMQPSTKTQEVLLGVWQNTLEKQQIGIQDNFFELGGDSISAVRVAALCEEHNIHFSVADLFECQTIELLAGLIDANELRAPVEEKKQEESFDMLSSDDLSILLNAD
ncbi:amino acid adenylation domain-containing protein [Paraglaciecola sp.]|uniref:amino acid adenylation domain-containing protein n=1 Tax=Paraglaciecola sp. TaxID=1920173 RepID=UPI0030F37528